MEPVRTITGTLAALPRASVDTDQIMPKQFLKRVERSGYGEFLFWDWRRLPDGEQDPDFFLNRPEHAGASILVTGPNFGCGSSREHAPWGLQDWGFRAVIAPSFADIFHTNCTKIGLLPVVLTEKKLSGWSNWPKRTPAPRWWWISRSRPSPPPVSKLASISTPSPSGGSKRVSTTSASPSATRKTSPSSRSTTGVDALASLRLARCCFCGSGFWVDE